MTTLGDLQAWLREWEATVDAYASAQKRMLAQDAEIARLRARVKELEDSCWEAGVRLTDLKLLCARAVLEMNEGIDNAADPVDGLPCHDTFRQLERAGQGLPLEPRVEEGKP